MQKAELHDCAEDEADLFSVRARVRAKARARARASVRVRVRR